MRSPVTAAKGESIWSGVGERAFYNDVNSLVKLHPVPGEFYPPHPSSKEGDAACPLSFEEEQQLADDLAFIATYEYGASYMVAATIEASSKDSQLVVRLAANEGVQRVVKQMFDKLCKTLRECANTEASRSSYIQQIFDTIVSLNCNRILGRLNSTWYRERKKPKPTHREGHGTPSKQLHETISRHKSRSPALAGILKQAQAFDDGFKNLELGKNMPQSGQIQSVVHLAFALTVDGVSLKSRLESLGITSSTRSDGQIIKIASYWSISTKLAKICRSHRDLFRNLRVETLEHYQPYCIANNSLTRYTHAEIQLIVHYQTSPKPWPRVIGSAKAACFLCNAFIQAHGHWYVTRAHRQVYDQWWVPDLQEYNAKALNRFRQALIKVHKDVCKEIRIKKSNGTTRNIVPNQSAVNLAKLVFPNVSNSTINSRQGAGTIHVVQQALDAIAVEAGTAGSQVAYAEAIVDPSAPKVADSDAQPSASTEELIPATGDVAKNLLRSASKLPKMPQSLSAYGATLTTNHSTAEPQHSRQHEASPTSISQCAFEAPRQQLTPPIPSSHRSIPEMVDRPASVPQAMSPMPADPLQESADVHWGRRFLNDASASLAYPQSTEASIAVSSRTIKPRSKNERLVAKAEPVCVDHGWLKIYACFGDEHPDPSDETGGPFGGEKVYRLGRVEAKKADGLHKVFKGKSVYSDLGARSDEKTGKAMPERIDVSRMMSGEQRVLRTGEEWMHSSKRELLLVLFDGDGAETFIACEWVE